MSEEALHPITPATVARRFGLWLLICSASAAPSFALGLSVTRGHVAGMAAGVLLFVLLYTAATSTPRFERLYRRPFVRPTMYWGYGARLLLSVSALTALTGMMAPWLSLDMIPGMVAVGVAGAIFGENYFGSGRGAVPSTMTFLPAFIATCIQGALLNVLVFVFMAVVYGLHRAFAKPPETQLRAFEVIVPEAREAP